ncbi:hypothetical protein [Nakamurella endophytica]|uniref:Ferredoxin reductase n=1 Tax=Nakamurella endophytica TaxID=1748367 RepID=A0A917SUA4_9ACTN|nr:hypothetical protein [Nakamurella endophytica]GGL96426.1 hypothetical protein GCM10011594_15230 [Nakamurella endophytica]
MATRLDGRAPGNAGTGPAERDLPPLLTGIRLRLAGGRLSPFHRVLWLIAAANVVFGVVFLLTRPSWNLWLGGLLTAASVDIGLAALMRQQYFVNALFSVATSAPLRWPLRMRAALAQVHHLPGGVHVGAATSATVWFVVYAVCVVVTPPPAAGSAQHVAILAVVVAIALDLLAMSWCARPAMRHHHHDLFEITHRYGGWLSIALFTALTVLHAAADVGPAGSDILRSPNTWILAVLFVFAAIPWLQLRRVPITITEPSNHVALVSFRHGRVRVGSASRIARHPLGQWHAFANMTTPGQQGFRIAVSRAGGWTGDFIADAPAHVWTRGVPTTGVGSVSRLFTKVVWIATGSGIAPALPHLLSDPTPARLVWVTRSPERTYGAGLVGEILAAQPDAVLWNSDEKGKPDLSVLAYQAYRDFGAEAVICISNKDATLRLVTELRRRGVPAYGPIWDS